MKLFKTRSKVQTPDVIITDGYKTNGNPNCVGKRLFGTFYLVFPKTCKEVEALMMAEHQVDKFAPERGDGVVVTASFLKLLDA